MNAPYPSCCREAFLRLPSCGFFAAIAAVMPLLMAGPAEAQSGGGDALHEAVEKYLDSAEPGKAGEPPVTDDVIRGLERDLGDAARLNPNAVFARMVVAMRRGDFRSASKLYQDLPRDYQRKLLVLRAKIWASIHTEKDIDAQREMIFLSHYADKQGGGEESRQAADFAGRMYGYLSGPLARPQKELEQGVFRRLAPEYKPVFEAGRKDVSERFAAIEVNLNAAQETAKAKEREQREEEIKTIAAQIAEMDKELKPMLASLKQAESDLARELKIDESKLELLSVGMVGLDKETDLLRQEIESLTKRIEELRKEAEHTTDPTKKQALLNQAQRFEGDLRKQQTKLSKQDGRLISLLNQKRAGRAVIDKQKATLDPQRKAVQELTAKAGLLRSQESELRKAPILGLSPEVVALQNQAQAMGTYLPEFWSTVKADILQSFD